MLSLFVPIRVVVLLACLNSRGGRAEFAVVALVAGTTATCEALLQSVANTTPNIVTYVLDGTT
jgi:hypothetical protein